MKKIDLQFVKERYIYIYAYIYLFISNVLFLLGNVKYVFSIPITIILIVGLVKSIKNSPKMTVSLFKSKKMIIILCLIIFWTFISGIGGFVWQNTWDHKFRNALFNDLVRYSWPVIQNSKALCYYLGFWLPSALVGKIFNLEIGYLFQTFWAILGISITFGIICQHLKKIKISNMILMIFFSGLDIFLYLIFSGLSIRESFNGIINGSHLELVTQYFNSSSNTTLMFWLYNQIIPFWVGIMLILQQENRKSIVFIYSLLLIFSPFPLVALIPVLVYLIFKDYEGDKKYDTLWMSMWEKIKSTCTYENVISIFLFVIVGLFFLSNIAVGEINILNINITIVFKYLCYIFFEYIVYLVFIYKKNDRNPILNILIITTFVLPFICLGTSYDFAWRTCIPLSFYIMLLIMKTFQDSDVNKKIKIFLIIILCLGAITPLTEIIRTVKNEVLVIKGDIKARSDSLTSIFEKEFNECYENFIGETDSLFYKYISK